METQFDDLSLPNIDEEYYCSPITKSSGFTPLMKWIFMANTNPIAMSMLKEIVKDPIELNKQNSKGWTPLMIACRNASFFDKDLIQILLDADADIKPKTNKNVNVLGLIVMQRSEITADIVDILIDAGVDIHNKNHEGYSPLMLSAAYSNVKTIKKLIDYGADIHTKNEKGGNILTLAIMHPRDFITEIVKILIDTGCDVNDKDNDNFTPLMASVRYSSAEITKMLIEYGSDVNSKDKNGMIALEYAVRCSTIDTVKKIDILINAGCDVNNTNKSGITPLMYAIKCSNTEIVKMLIDAGADVNIKENNGYTALIYAIISSNVEIVKILIDTGADVNIKENNGHTALKICVEHSNANMTKILIEHGADVNIKKSNGNNALVCAISNSTVDTFDKIDILIRAGCDINNKNRSQNTPLMYAVKYMNVRASKMLINAGADINTLFSTGLTCIHIACVVSDPILGVEMIQILIDAGADINIKDNNGNNLLFHATNTKIVETLIRMGCDVNNKNNRDNDPLFYAVQNRNMDMVRILLDYGANITRLPILYIVCAKLKMNEDAEIVRILANSDSHLVVNHNIRKNVLVLIKRRSHPDDVVKIMKILLKAKENSDYQTDTIKKVINIGGVVCEITKGLKITGILTGNSNLQITITYGAPDTWTNSDTILKDLSELNPVSAKINMDKIVIEFPHDTNIDHIKELYPNFADMEICVTYHHICNIFRITGIDTNRITKLPDIITKPWIGQCGGGYNNGIYYIDVCVNDVTKVGDFISDKCWESEKYGLSLIVDTTIHFDMDMFKHCPKSIGKYICDTLGKQSNLDNKSIKQQLQIRESVQQILKSTIIECDPVILIGLIDESNLIQPDLYHVPIFTKMCMSENVTVKKSTGQIIVNGLPSSRVIMIEKINAYLNLPENKFAEEHIPLTIDLNIIRVYIDAILPLIENMGIVCSVSTNGVHIKGSKKYVDKFKYSMKQMFDNITVSKLIVNELQSDQTCAVCLKNIGNKLKLHTCYPQTRFSSNPQGHPQTRFSSNPEGHPQTRVSSDPEGDRAYCKDCFKKLAQSVNDCSYVPCISCDNLFDLRVLKYFNDLEIYEMFSPVIEKYVAENRDTYVRCLTPDCKGIYYSKGCDILYCKDCSHVYCLKCRHNYYGPICSHDGLSCEKFREKNNLDVKSKE